MKRYNRISSGFYESTNGEKIAVRPVNREYAGNTKKPVYFISRYNKTSKRFEYISGLFKTKQERTFSYDLKDDLGIKVLQVCQFSEGGDTITLQSKDEFNQVVS
jgi:hypothetical protein